jgi:two-component system sensor histidine kinase/response regulator
MLVNDGTWAGVGSGAVRLTDPDVLLRATGGDRQACHRMLTLFLQIFPAMVLSLEQVFATGNRSCVAQAAHMVKGCLVLVGATGSAERVERIESAARYETAQCRLAEFEKTVQELRTVIEEIESELGPVALLQ